MGLGFESQRNHKAKSALDVNPGHFRFYDSVGIKPRDLYRRNHENEMGAHVVGSLLFALWQLAPSRGWDAVKQRFGEFQPSPMAHGAADKWPQRTHLPLFNECRVKKIIPINRNLPKIRIYYDTISPFSRTECAGHSRQTLNTSFRSG